MRHGLNKRLQVKPHPVQVVASRAAMPDARRDTQLTGLNRLRPRPLWDPTVTQPHQSTRSMQAISAGKACMGIHVHREHILDYYGKVHGTPESLLMMQRHVLDYHE
jgi:hypothetical protein